jgi:hypothetical protein
LGHRSTTYLLISESSSGYYPATHSPARPASMRGGMLHVFAYLWRYSATGLEDLPCDPGGWEGDCQCSQPVIKVGPETAFSVSP